MFRMVSNVRININIQNYIINDIIKEKRRCME